MPQKERRSPFLHFIKSVGSVIGFLVSLFFLFIFVIVFLGFLSLLISPGVDVKSGNIAVIPVTGVISTGGGADSFLSPGIADSDQIVEWIKKADEEDKIKAIIFERNSPGGSPVATDEIASAIKKTKKPTVAVIRESGTSGAFWIATSTDTVFANKMSLTGSIGVIASRLEFAGLLENYNITYRRIVAGKYKDAGSRFKEMTPEEIALFQKTVDKIHEYFIEEVATNRDLNPVAVRQIAHGFVFLGEEAKRLGLIDFLGGKDDAVEFLEEKLSIEADLVEFKERATLRDIFGKVTDESFYYMGQGIGSVLVTPRAYEQFEVWT